MVFPIAGGNESKGYEISNSLRFNDDDSASLSFTPSGNPTDADKFTISCWIKLGNIGVNNAKIYDTGGSDDNNRFALQFQAKIIWAHAGTSAEIHRYQGRVEGLFKIVSDLLATYDNLYIDLSWTMLDPYLIHDGQADSDWLGLVKAYPDRFMAGTDLVGRFDNLGKKIHEFEPFLDALPDEVADRMARTNLLDLLPKDED